MRMWRQYCHLLEHMPSLAYRDHPGPWISPSRWRPFFVGNLSWCTSTSGGVKTAFVTQGFWVFIFVLQRFFPLFVFCVWFFSAFSWIQLCSAFLFFVSVYLPARFFVFFFSLFFSSCFFADWLVLFGLLSSGFFWGGVLFVCILCFEFLPDYKSRNNHK